MDKTIEVVAKKYSSKEFQVISIRGATSIQSPSTYLYPSFSLGSILTIEQINIINENEDNLRPIVVTVTL